MSVKLTLPSDTNDDYELRRIHCDLMMCFKITRQLVSIPFLSMFELSASPATRGNPFKLAYPDYGRPME